jgi:hypothetical protein
MNNYTKINPYLFQSAEIRWFLPASADWEISLKWFLGDDSSNASHTPKSISDKICNSKNIKREELRTDEYLIMPHCTSVGVKQRQGKLEVKAQIGMSEKYLNNSFSGEINCWSKWSLQPNNINLMALEKDLQDSGRWIKIHKTRYLLKLSLSENTIIEVSPEDWPEKGCQVELTQVRTDANSRNWISLGFEAFGGTFEKMEKNLKDSISFFFSKRNNPPMVLSSNNSMSYPLWLQIFQKNNF